MVGDISNVSRAERASVLVEQYTQEAEVQDSCVTDLMVDLLHLAVLEYGMTSVQVISRVCTHFAAETLEDSADPTTIPEWTAAMQRAKENDPNGR